MKMKSNLAVAVVGTLQTMRAECVDVKEREMERNEWNNDKKSFYVGVG